MSQSYAISRQSNFNLLYFSSLGSIPYLSCGNLTCVSSVLVKQTVTKAHLPHQHRWQICSAVTCGLMCPPSETLNTQVAFSPVSTPPLLLSLPLLSAWRVVFSLKEEMMRKNPHTPHPPTPVRTSNSGN